MDAASRNRSGNDNTNAKFEVTSPKQFVHKHYAVFGLMISTLPISFFMHKLRRIILFSRNIIFGFRTHTRFISTCKAIMEIFLQVFLVKWSERFSMAKIILISYTCYTIAAIGYGLSATIASLFFTLLFLVIGGSIALNHLLRFVSEIALQINVDCIFQFTGYIGIYPERAVLYLVPFY